MVVSAPITTADELLFDTFGGQPLHILHWRFTTVHLLVDIGRSDHSVYTNLVQ
jgi:hypothetical protein